jgi:hypothetical protein
MQRYELHLHEIDRHPAGDVFMATGPERTVLEPYGVYAQDFSKIDW